MNQISQNINYLRKKNKISQQFLADKLEIPRSTLGDYERGKTEPNLTMLMKLSSYFDVTIDALIKANISHKDLEIIKNKDFKILALTVDGDNRNNIELVDTKAEAGYLESFNDPSYIKELPKINFPNIPHGTYRGFEIQGESMQPMEPGSIVIASYVERLEEIKEDKTYIVASKTEGLVYKRVKIDRANQQLLLISDNENFAPFTIDFAEVDEIWKYYAHLSFSDSKTMIDDLVHSKLHNIEKKVFDLHQKLV